MEEAKQVIDTINAFRSVYVFLNETKKFLKKSKKGRLKLFSSKKEEIEQRFKEALNGSKNAIEARIWNGIGNIIHAECGPRAEREICRLMGTLIDLFNDISMRLNPETLDDKLVNHLQRQLETLEKDAAWVNNISNEPNKEKEALDKIESYRRKLWEFFYSMKPYLTKREMG